MTVLILVRHGATAYNAEGRLQGRLDVPLADAGAAQARAAGAALAADYGAPDALLASPLARAWDTARLMGEAFGVEPSAEEALTQRSYGAWEGLTWDEVRSGWPEEFARRAAALDPRVPGWETSAAVGERVATALTAACKGRELVVAVSHGGAMMYGCLALLGLDPASAALGSLGHGMWNVMRRRTAGEWTLERYAVGVERD